MAPRKTTIASAKKQLAVTLFEVADNLAALKTAEKKQMKADGLPDEMLKTLTDAMAGVTKAKAAAARAEKKAAAAPAAPKPATPKPAAAPKPATPKPAAPKVFSVGRLRVYDSSAVDDNAFLQKNIGKEYVIETPEQLGELIDMSRSFKKDGEFETDYIYDLNLVAGDCELALNYDSPSEIEIAVHSKGPKENSDQISILANLAYKKTTGELKVSKLSLVLAVAYGNAPPSKTELTDRIERAVGMFRHIRSIAPLAIGEKLKATVKVMSELSPPKKMILKQQLADSDIVRKI